MAAADIDSPDGTDPVRHTITGRFSKRPSRGLNLHPQAGATCSTMIVRVVSGLSPFVLDVTISCMWTSSLNSWGVDRIVDHPQWNYVLLTRGSPVVVW